MKDPEHPDVTFKAGSLGRFAKKYGITAEISAVDPMGMEEGPRVRRTRWFVANLQVGDYTLNRMIEFLRYREVMPTVEDVLDYLLNEARAHEALKNDIPKAMEMTGYSEAQARQWLRGIAEDVKETQTLLGPAAYAEFLTISDKPRE